MIISPFKWTLLLVAIIAVQPILSTAVPESNEISDLQQSKRYKLVAFAFENLHRSLWPEELYPAMKNYLNDVKKWSDHDEMLQQSQYYVKIQQTLKTCLDLLEELSNHPFNCSQETALKAKHDTLKALFKSVESERCQQMWASKYLDFTLQMRTILRKSADKFYILLTAAVAAYDKSLDEVEEYEEVDILRWNERFIKETDFSRKQLLTIEFMGLFPDERNILESDCKIQYTNFL
uniref:Uncharacterized protein n=1 Tax=Stomoxys calcitrans TaxID=35570 RepID=A0A1I8PYV1_STOCA